MLLPSTLLYEKWTLVHALRAGTDGGPKPGSFSFPGSEPVNRQALDRRSDQLATGLATLGVGPEDRVAIIARNSLEFFVTVLAVHKRRAVVVPLNVELRGRLLAHQLTTSRPSALVIDAELQECLEGLPVEAKTFAHTIVIGDFDESTPDAIAFAAVAGSATNRDQVLLPAPEDGAAILFTSGTTGPAKGVLMPHAHCFLFGALQAQATATSADDTVFVALPMFHVNALFMALGSCLITGASAQIVRRFSASTWLEEVRASGATVTNMVGVMAEFLSGRPPTPDDRRHLLTRVLAIPVSPTWAAPFQQRFGIRFVQVYGMTECNIVSFSDPSDPLEPGCTGPIADEFFDVQIVSSDTDRPLPTGATGEIVVRPRLSSCFMAGYFGADDRTVESWRNLWFHTGDAGYLDPRRRLHFVDRLKDCIRRRGENISAFEIEQALNQHPAVLESAVIGVKTPLAGGEEEIKAVVVASGSAISATELHDWSVPQLPRYAVPRFIEIVPELPKTATGKLQKDALRAAGVTSTTVDCLAGALS